MNEAYKYLRLFWLGQFLISLSSLTGYLFPKSGAFYSAKCLHRLGSRGFKGLSLPIVLGLVLLWVVFPLQAGACGWAGDGEADEDDAPEVVIIGADGKPLPKDWDETEDPKFRNKMGNRHRTGETGKINYREAMRWYRLAAGQGYSKAQNNLGAMYEQGLGVAKNDITAAHWYRLAAEQGNSPAQHSLGVMYLQGRGVPQYFDEAAKWILMAAEGGHGSAYSQIGIMYWEGQGLARDRIKAYKWWKIGHEKGDDASSKLLEDVRAKMAPEKIEAAEKLLVTAVLPKKKQTALGLYLTAKQAFRRWQTNPDKYKIIDVRSRAEYIFVGHAPMAYNIPIRFYRNNSNRVSKRVDMPLNKHFVSDVKKKFSDADTLLVICRSGVRSSVAVNILAEAGFKKVYSVTDGFEGDSIKAPGSYNHGKRIKNGWKNSRLPWTYELDPKP